MLLSLHPSPTSTYKAVAGKAAAGVINNVKVAMQDMEGGSNSPSSNCHSEFRNLLVQSHSNQPRYSHNGNNRPISNSNSATKNPSAQPHSHWLRCHPNLQ